MITANNVLYAVYRMDESEHGFQEFRIISLTDESGIIDSERLKVMDLSALRKTFVHWTDLEQALVKLAKNLDCDRFVCLSLPEYNRLVAESTDLEMLNRGMKSFAKTLSSFQQNNEGDEVRAPVNILAHEKDREGKKSWMGRIFS